MEAYWNDRKKSFIENAEAVKDSKELVSLYQDLMGQLKNYAIAEHTRDEALCQAIALLFSQASQSAELALSQSLPTVKYAKMDSRPARSGKLLSLLLLPAVRYCLYGAGLVLCLLSSLRAWPGAVMFAAAAALEFAGGHALKNSGDAVPVAVVAIQTDYLERFISRQVKNLDQQIQDMEALLVNDRVTEDVEIDDLVMVLCQSVWACANAGYSTEAALFNAEKLLARNGLRAVEYTPETRTWFDVMPTRMESCTVYPALKKISDNTMVLKGQYIEKKA